MPRFSETGASSAPSGISQLQYSAPRRSFCRRQDRRSTGSCRVAAEAGRADSGTPDNSGRRVLLENSCNARGSPSLSRTVNNRLLIVTILQLFPLNVNPKVLLQSAYFSCAIAQRALRPHADSAHRSGRNKLHPLAEKGWHRRCQPFLRIISDEYSSSAAPDSGCACGCAGSRA